MDNWILGHEIGYARQRKHSRTQSEGASKWLDRNWRWLLDPKGQKDPDSRFQNSIRNSDDARAQLGLRSAKAMLVVDERNATGHRDFLHEGPGPGTGRY